MDILYLIGLREYGRLDQKLSKEDKINLFHIGTCAVLERLGFYQFVGIDADLWPHFEVKKPLPALEEEAEKELLKEAIVSYFEDNQLL